MKEGGSEAKINNEGGGPKIFLVTPACILLNAVALSRIQGKNYRHLSIFFKKTGHGTETLMGSVNHRM